MATFTLTKNGVAYTSATLGITMLKSSSRPLISPTRARSGTVPGRHGKVDYGADLDGLTFSLSCVFAGATSQANLRDLGQTLAGILLSAETGRPAQLKLSFSDMAGLSWAVVYSGDLDLKMLGPMVGEFTLELSAYDPFAREAEDETEGTITTSPGSLTVTNSGNVPAPARYILKNLGVATIHGFTLTRVKEV
jgi:hypothetical protein